VSLPSNEITLARRRAFFYAARRQLPEEICDDFAQHYLEKTVVRNWKQSLGQCWVDFMRKNFGDHRVLGGENKSYANLNISGLSESLQTCSSRDLDLRIDLQNILLNKIDTADCALVFMLCCGVSQELIAKKLSKSQGAISYRLSKIRKELNDSLGIRR